MYILRVKRSQELYAIRFIHEALEWHYCERKFKSFTLFKFVNNVNVHRMTSREQF